LMLMLKQHGSTFIHIQVCAPEWGTEPLRCGVRSSDKSSLICWFFFRVEQNIVGTQDMFLSLLHVDNGHAFNHMRVSVTVVHPRLQLCTQHAKWTNSQMYLSAWRNTKPSGSFDQENNIQWHMFPCSDTQFPYSFEEQSRSLTSCWRYTNNQNLP